MNQSTTTNFAGTLADGTTRHLALSFNGGTLTLGSADTYSGGTTIGAGTLKLGNAAALGTGALTMSGGTLDLNTNLPILGQFQVVRQARLRTTMPQPERARYQ